MRLLKKIVEKLVCVYVAIEFVKSIMFGNLCFLNVVYSDMMQKLLAEYSEEEPTAGSSKAKQEDFNKSSGK